MRCVGYCRFQVLPIEPIGGFTSSLLRVPDATLWEVGPPAINMRPVASQAGIGWTKTLLQPNDTQAPCRTGLIEGFYLREATLLGESNEV